MLQFEKLSEEKAAENSAFLQFIRRNPGMNARNLNRIARDLAAREWERTDCTECGHCCRLPETVLNSADIRRLSKRLGMKTKNFTAKYLKRGEDGLEFREARCPFQKNNLCSVYEDRPRLCREFPYLHSEIKSRMPDMIVRAAQCPVVYNTLEGLKKETGFFACRDSAKLTTKGMKKEAAADEDIKRGRVKRFGGVDDLLKEINKNNKKPETR